MKPLTISFLLLAALTTGACNKGSASGGALAPDGLPMLIIASSIVDLNGDGKNDLIISNGQSVDGDTAPRVFLNDGNGTSFTLQGGAIPNQYNGSHASVAEIKPGDYDEDGNIDLLVLTVAENYRTSQIQLFLGNGNGKFSDATSNISHANWPDSSLACTSAPNSNNAGPLYLRVTDVDQDGHQDFTLSFGGIGSCGGVTYRNDGTGHFAPATMMIGGIARTSFVDTSGNYTTEVLEGDLNGDGKVDFFAPRMSNTQLAFINTSTPGNLSFSVVTSNFISGILHGALLDIDGDGALDLVGSMAYMGPTYQIAVPVYAYKGNGMGGFTVNNSLLSEQPFVHMVRQFLVADLNSDNKKDLLVLNCGPDISPFPGERSWMFLNNGLTGGSGKLMNVTSTNFTLAKPYTHQGAVGDLNGDGFVDLLINNSYQPSMSAEKVSRVWINNGAGSFTSSSVSFH